MPRPTPAHTLGPHVLGQRIVVRRVLRGETGPSGGPAMTDVLGVCLAWNERECVVQPAEGPAVSVSLADIVSGKPVPPRPSPRLRISPDAAQRHAMSLFDDLVTEPVGGWTLRHSPTHAARRANSVLAVAPLAVDGGLDAGLAYDAVTAWYSRLDRRPIAAVVRDTDEELLFTERGWTPESADGDTVFQLASVATLARARVSSRVRGDLQTEVVVTGAGTTIGATVTLSEGATALATGVAALDGDWVGFRGVRVDPAQRRRGLGRAVMAALVGWAAERGGSTAYLQVLSDNPPALSLYADLGFVEHHRYRYLAAP